MNHENRFLRVNQNKKVINVIKRKWLTISAIALALVGGSVSLAHINASANVGSHNYRQSTILNKHTALKEYKFIDPSTILANYNLKNKVQNNKYSNTQSRQIVRRATNQENIPNNSLTRSTLKEPLDSANKIDQLKLYQTTKYNGNTFSRTYAPFNTIKITRPVSLHNLVSLKDHNNLPQVVNGTYHILKSFNQYGPKTNYIRYLISFHHHNYYITGNPDFVSFVLPSKNYRYYQSRINNALAKDPNNPKLSQIQDSIESLNAQHIIDYHIYATLYLDVYNIQQEEHPIFINKPILINKPNNSSKRTSRHLVNNSDQDHITSVILHKMNLINTNDQIAAKYDNKALNKLNNLNLDGANINHIKSIILNEITSNNNLIARVNFNTSKILNNIDNRASLKFETSNLAFQMNLTNNIKANAKQILNNIALL